VLYRLLRALSQVSLRWFYSRMDTEGLERIPASGPVLLAVNHPNALVDAMVVAAVCPRRITFTGRATLFANPLLAAFLRAVGVVPLVRTRDVAELRTGADASRNERAFRLMHQALAGGSAVMIFPEGVTGDRPALAPLRTGAARLAFQALEAGVRDLVIVPVGLTFERKDTPRTRVFLQTGEPIAVAQWPRTGGGAELDVRELTAELDRRLRAVTLNFESVQDAERDLSLARRLARVFRGTQAVPEVWETHTLSDQVAIARRIEEARAALRIAPPDVQARANDLLQRLERFRATLLERRMAPEDLEIDTGVSAGAWFVLREALVVLVAGPFAAWGWLNHWLPFSLARVVAQRDVESAADPAMRTIVSGVGLVLLFYVVQGATVWALFGGPVAAAYWVSLPVTGDVNFRLRERLVRAIRRARAYLRFRREPALRSALSAEQTAIRQEALAVERLLLPRAQ
jgi:glycerol-3-phosphate O-acyltransferase / dihydroxyacetone phosphate acyltransferase